MREGLQDIPDLETIANKETQKPSSLRRRILVMAGFAILREIVSQVDSQLFNKREQLLGQTTSSAEKQAIGIHRIKILAAGLEGLSQALRSHVSKRP